MSMPSAVAPVIVFSLMRTPRIAASADVTSMALPPVLARLRPRISTPVRSPFAVFASTTMVLPALVSRGAVPAGTIVPNGATVNPTPSPCSFTPFLSVMPPSGVVWLSPLNTKMMSLAADAVSARASVSNASVERPSPPAALLGPIWLLTYQTRFVTVIWMVPVTGVTPSVTWNVNESVPVKPAFGT